MVQQSCDLSGTKTIKEHPIQVTAIVMHAGSAWDETIIKNISTPDCDHFSLSSFIST